MRQLAHTHACETAALRFRCLKIGGQEALDNWVEAQSDLVLCVLENFNKDDIKKEAEAKKETGDLDLVFKKYCE